MNYAKNRKLNIIFFIIYFTFIQEFLCLILYNFGVNIYLVKGIYYLKDILVLVLGAVPFIKYMTSIIVGLSKRKTKLFDLGVVIFCVCILLYSILGIRMYSLFTVLLCARTYLIPIILISIGRSVYEGPNTLEEIKKFIFSLSWLIIITTLIERIFIPTGTWVKLDLVNYNHIIKGIASWSTNHLIVNFYSSGMRRAIGLTCDPLLLSYFCIPLFFALVIFSLKKASDQKKYYISAFMIFVVQLLTLTRAVLVAEACVVFIVYVYRVFKNPKVKISRLILQILLIVIIPGMVLLIYYSSDFIVKTITLSDGSAFVHYNSFLYGLSNSMDNIMGLGIGHGSLVSNSIGNTNYASETSYFTLIMDMGIISFIALLVIFGCIIVKCLRKSISRDIIGESRSITNMFCIVVILATIVFFITGFFSPQLWTMKSVIFYWLLVGVGTKI